MMERTATAFDMNDLLRPEHLQNPYPFYRQLREEEPIHWSDSWGCWILTRYADVVPSLRDPRLSNMRRISLYVDQLPHGIREDMQPICHHLTSQMAFTDPPDHTRLRPLITKAFTPRTVEGLRPRIQEIVDSLLDTVQASGRMDMVKDFAFPLPMIVIAEMIGLPPADRDRFRKTADDIVAFLGTGRARPAESRQALDSFNAMTHYMIPLLEERRRNPQKDVLSDLIGVVDGSDRLSEEELIAACVSFVTAGHETTKNLIANGMLALLQRPDQLQLLKDDPSLIPTAVEEMLRYDSPVQRDWGVAMEDVEVGDKLFRKDDIVLQILGAANRDPEQFPDPDKFDVARKDNKHVAFGFGIHFCLGAPLARLEGQIAIRTLLERMPNIALVSNKVEWHQNIAFRGPKQLPVVF